MRIILEYVVVFLIILCVNNFFLIGKNKKDSVPMELKYLELLYKININKINYKRFSFILSLVNSFIISTIYIIVLYLLHNLLWQIIIGFILLILMIIICYGLLGQYYERKSKNV